MLLPRFKLDKQKHEGIKEQQEKCKHHSDVQFPKVKKKGSYIFHVALNFPLAKVAKTIFYGIKERVIFCVKVTFSKEPFLSSF